MCLRAFERMRSESVQGCRYVHVYMCMRGQQDVPDWWLEGRKLFHSKLQRNTPQWTVIVKTGTGTHFHSLRRKCPAVFNFHLSDRLTDGKVMTG